MPNPLELNSDPEAIDVNRDSDLATPPLPLTDDAESAALLAQARQGDVMALRQFLNGTLGNVDFEVIEVAARGSVLQMSIAGERVPEEEKVLPLMRRGAEQLELIQFETVELYGQRLGSELPYWRAVFKVGEPEPIEDLLDIEPLPIPATPNTPSDAAERSLASETAPDLPTTELASATDDLSLETRSVSDPGNASLTVEPVDAAVVIEPPAEETLENMPSIPRTISPERQQAAQAFLDRYSAGERDFAAIDLSETDLSRINLTLADLRQAQLIWTNLQESALYHVNLSGAKLRHANLKNAKLRSANLKGADFLNADLSGADLSWSNLSGANLTGADLTDASLNNAIFSCVVMPDGTLLD